jgi:hypothetical protein
MLFSPETFGIPETKLIRVLIVLFDIVVGLLEKLSVHAALAPEAAQCFAARESGLPHQSSIAGALRGLPFRRPLRFPLLPERAVDKLYLRFKLSLTIRQYLSNRLLLRIGQRIEVNKF